MNHREKHKIESNCVSFNDDCYNETNSYPEHIQETDGVEKKTIAEAVSSVYKTGQSFISYLEQKLSSIKQNINKSGSSNV